MPGALIAHTVAMSARSAPSASDACDSPQRARARLPWPAPALLAWLGAWGLTVLSLPRLAQWGASPIWAWAAGAALGAVVAGAMRRASGLRRAIVAGGFPVSALASGAAAAVPAWVWLLPLALLLAAYPLRAWRDAPLFPTPARALAGLAAFIHLAPGDRVLDVGCGLGHGLAALRSQWPQARIEGVEWSRALRLAAALRCRWATVRRGDMWADHWGDYKLVYLFQRPESMARAWAKAQAEMAPGSWLVSLDFEVPGELPIEVLRPPGAQPVWVYRVGQTARRDR
jgi:hypothetical protein